jgi:hypothetical protein
MPYPLEKMLTVRTHRENKKLNHVVQCKEQVKQAETVKRQKEQELSSYRQWRPMEEKRLFDHLQQAPANVHDVMYFTDTVNTLREKQIQKAHRVQEALNQVNSAEQALTKARRKYAEACRKKMKIAEHKEIWMEEYRIQMEQKEENELEEAAQVMRCNGDKV